MPLSVSLPVRVLRRSSGEEVRRRDGISMPPWLLRDDGLFGTGC